MHTNSFIGFKIRVISFLVKYNFNNSIKYFLSLAGQFLALIRNFHFKFLQILNKIKAKQKVIAHIKLPTKRIDFYMIIVAILNCFTGANSCRFLIVSVCKLSELYFLMLPLSNYNSFIVYKCTIYLNSLIK